MKQPSSHTTDTFIHEDEGDGIIIQEKQDVEPILRQNKALQGMEHSKKAVGRHAASIPMVIYQKWMREFEKERGYSYQHARSHERQAFLKAKLNDPANAFLRTWQGKL